MKELIFIFLLLFNVFACAENNVFDCAENAENAENLDSLFINSVRRNKINDVKLLLDRGADLNIKNNKGNTALMYACLLNHEPIVKFLVDKGADLNIKNNEGYTALDIALNQKYRKIANIIKRNK
ncbi:ankyrin repeat domain-containing protein [uncultured Brachyspira sp.]|uniref:ankyrin repeat domain-containing protein n=1 Tax=uncultured Brachyspira sp. TaxID=221953 RepID=UPI0025E4C9F2|nr:ankyrin repeat domain-containing protein [uncultured Brachyspira sp.]